jgi:hypothetical protein
MAGLLPYLGHDNVYGRIQFEQSWKDPANWLAAKTLIPEFLDPMYPLRTRTVSHPAFPFEIGATHYVGIAGVGRNAADYPPNDPAYDSKRGILSYDLSRGLKEVQDNRGLANTILLMQVPHDGPAEVTPWIAGGGSTLQGVPEKNSIAPFLLTTDKNGKQIQYNGKSGSFAAMADGSVRFIDGKISDEAFKALCVVKGPGAGKAKDDLTDWAPVVPPPKVEVKEVKKVEKEPVKKEEKEPVKKEKEPVKKGDKQKSDKESSKVESQPSAALRTKLLKQIGLAYHDCLSNSNKPPAKIEDLAPYYENDAKITDALKKGQFVFIYNSSIKNMPAGTAKTILAYEKEVPTSGGLVLMADASVRSMTADEFKKAPKAAGK